MSSCSLRRPPIPPRPPSNPPPRAPTRQPLTDSPRPAPSTASRAGLRSFPHCLDTHTQTSISPGRLAIPGLPLRSTPSFSVRSRSPSPLTPTANFLRRFLPTLSIDLLVRLPCDTHPHLIPASTFLLPAHITPRTAASSLHPRIRRPLRMYAVQRTPPPPSPSPSSASGWSLRANGPGAGGDYMAATGKQPNFLQKLYEFLSLEPHPCPDVIYWASDQRQLVIANPDRLVKEVLPRLFKHDKMSSFGRQLNIYGFSRLFPGRQFKDASGQISDASVWAHPTLHRLSSPGEIAGVKRRAAPKLFRTRRLANGQVVRSRAGPGVEAKFREVREEIAESKRARLSISSPPVTNGMAALTPMSSSSLSGIRASYTDRGASTSPPPCPVSQSGSFASPQGLQSPHVQGGQGLPSHVEQGTHDQQGHQDDSQPRPFWFPASPPLDQGQVSEFQQAQQQAATPHQPRATPFGALTINTSGLSAFPRYRQSSLHSHSTQPALESITEQSELDSSPLYPGAGEAMEIDQAFAPISFTSVPLMPPNFTFVPHIIPSHGGDRGNVGLYGPPSWPGAGEDVDMADRSFSTGDPSPATPAQLGPSHPNTTVSCPASVHTSPLMTSANVQTAWARLFGNQSNPATNSMPPTPISAMLQDQQSQARKPLLEVAVPNNPNLSTHPVNTPHSQTSPTDAIMPYGHSFSVFGAGGQQEDQAFSSSMPSSHQDAQAQSEQMTRDRSRLQSPVFQDLQQRLSLAEQGNAIMTPASTGMISPPPTASHSAPMSQLGMTPEQVLANASDPSHMAQPQIYQVEDQASGAPASLPHSIVDAEMPMSPTMRRDSYKLASSWEQETIDPRWVSPVSSQWATPAITRAPSPSGGLHGGATASTTAEGGTAGTPASAAPNPPPLIHSHSFPLSHVDEVNGMTGADNDGAFGMSFASWRAGLTVPQTHPPLGGVPMLDLGMGLGTQSYPPLARAGTELARRVTTTSGMSAVKE